MDSMLREYLNADIGQTIAKIPLALCILLGNLHNVPLVFAHGHEGKADCRKHGGDYNSQMSSDLRLAMIGRIWGVMSDICRNSLLFMHLMLVYRTA